MNRSKQHGTRQMKRHTIRNQVALRSKPQMERIVKFVAEWFSLEVLHGVSMLMSVWAREWQYKDILNDIDGLMWEDLSEDRQNSCQMEEKVLPCDVPPLAL